MANCIGRRKFKIRGIRKEESSASRQIERIQKKTEQNFVIRDSISLKISHRARRNMAFMKKKNKRRRREENR